MAQKIYALLVGINDYQGNVKKLTGCLNDVDHFHAYLKKNFKDNLYDVVLKDSQATRADIIKQFRQHLCRATKEDVVVFHYSGHGARWKSAKEFSAKGFSGEWNEGLVCYDSRVGDYDLADKELAVLLHEVAKNDPHIAVIFDCCHSGSGTRDADTFNNMEPRATYEMKDERPLDSYLEGYYAKLYRQGEFGIPASKHVLLAACEKKQTAKEDKQTKSGIFSSTLLEVLDKFGGDITYADLFMRCRAFVLKRADEQTPQFEPFEGFNAWSGFLGRKAASSAQPYRVENKNNRWEINAGAMQGFSTAKEKRVELVLYHEDDPSREAGKAHTTWVGPEKSRLDLDFSPSSNDARYLAKLTSLPAPPIPVYFEGDEAGKEILQKVLKDNQSIGADLIDFKEGTRYALLVKDGQFILKQRETDLIIQGVKGVLQRTRDLASQQYSEESAKVMLSIFKRVAAWERGLALENPHTKFDPNKIDFTFYEVLNDGKEESPYKGKNDLTLDYVKVGDKYKSVRGRLKARNNTSQPLWFALLHFSRKYGITSLSNVEIDPAEEAIIWGDDPKKNAFGLPKEVNESIDTFKLIVSDEKVDDFLLAQAELELGKIISSDEERDIVSEDEEQEKIENDWFTKTIRIKTVRQIDQVNDNKDVTLAQGQIVIKKHPAVKANLSLRAAKTADRGVGQDFDFYKAYERYGVEMFDFAGGARGDEAKKNVENILELNDIKDDADLEKNPLEIDVNIPLAEHEYILPVATDGEHVFPCGDATKDDDGFTHIRVDHIPEPDNRRDVVKALKMYFIKTYLKQDTVNQLCWVEFKPDGAIVRQKSNLANKVAAAQNILLLIHGIIGDTEVMAKGLRLAGLEQKFDLVLTYDYENLSTPIEETAEKLKQQLAAAGLGDTDNKKLTLLVHSMGGLVARCFIEQKSGKEMVDHLVMCGTPNNGSPFGKIEAARKLMNILTPLALTYVPMVVPFAGALLFRLKKITPTLEQMDPKSPFITALNGSGDPRVRYTILAGDINEYQEPAERSFLQKVLEKAGKGFVFNLLFGARPHDIAVSVESILGVDGARDPAPVRKNVPCHHLNYFISDAGQEELKKVEW